MTREKHLLPYRWETVYFAVITIRCDEVLAPHQGEAMPQVFRDELFQSFFTYRTQMTNVSADFGVRDAFNVKTAFSVLCHKLGPFNRYI